MSHGWKKASFLLFNGGGVKIRSDSHATFAAVYHDGDVFLWRPVSDDLRPSLHVSSPTLAWLFFFPNTYYDISYGAEDGVGNAICLLNNFYAALALWLFVVQ